MPEEVVLLALASMGMFTGIVVTVIRAWSKHLERKHHEVGGDDLRAELEELRDLVVKGDIHERLAEVEERLDFAERLLTQGSEPPAHPSPTPG